MGLFKQAKKSSTDEAASLAEQAFDEAFRSELQEHGRAYFEKVIHESSKVFKKELDATTTQVKVDLKEHVIKRLDTVISQINIELKSHVTKQLDSQFAQYSTTMKTAQDAALESQHRNAQALEEQHDKLTQTLQKSIANQSVMLDSVFQENMTRMTTMREAQDTALQSINRSVAALEQQQQQLSETLQKTIARQEELMMTAFQDNMAQIIEHYLFGALGEQYDLKAQVPSIIKRMEANKQAMMDDMKL